MSVNIIKKFGHSFQHTSCNNATLSWVRRIIGKTTRDRIRNEIIWDKLQQNETLTDKIKKNDLRGLKM